MQLTQIIADKEKKSSSYKDGKLDSLSDEKVAKIKKFSKEYIARILRKMEKSGDKRKGSSSSAPGPTQAGSSTSLETPNSHGDPNGSDIPMTDMTVEEAMDLEDDSGSEDDGEAIDMEGRCNPPSLLLREQFVEMKDKAMDIWGETIDPRSRPSSWDRDRDKDDINIFKGPNGSTLSIGS